MQDPKEIEASHTTPDQWGYKSNPEDLKRKDKIIHTLVERYERFDYALDLGACEGWITQDLPAKLKCGYELSTQARERFPSSVIPVIEPSGKYDLITATGIMYAHYDYRHFLKLIEDHSSKVVLFCNIKDWEIPELKHGKLFHLNEVYSEEFPYREYIQKLRLFEVVK